MSQPAGPSRRSFLLGALALVPARIFRAQAAAPVRPRITGISHVAFYVSDLPAALAFWHGLLGFDESYTRTDPNTHAETLAFLKINDHQYVELLTGPLPSPPSRLSHLAFAVDDVEAMRAYLQAQQVAVPPKVSKTRTGDLTFEVLDPDGTHIEFVQPLATGVEAQGIGKFLPSTRLSSAIYHAGFLVGNAARSLDFYGRILGFQETWRGGANPAQLSWINMRVPDGTDYVEFMLYSGAPSDFGSRNHLSLVVPDVKQAVAKLRARPAFESYSRPVAVHLGVNQKRQVNLFDPDGTRVELMEPNTVTGKPAPSSSAPPPAPGSSVVRDGGR